MVLTQLKHWLNSRSRKGAAIKMIVAHGTAGASAESSIEWLEQVGLSYHYVIERNGKVTKCVPVARAALHAGNSYGPEESAKHITRSQRKGYFTAGTCVNNSTIGIAFANWEDYKDPITEAQWRAFKDLCLTLKRDIPTLEWLSTHWAVSPGRKDDPRMMMQVKLRNVAKELGLKAWVG